DQVVGAARGEALQRQHGGPLHVRVGLLQVGRRGAERLRELVGGGRAAQRGGQLLAGGGGGPGLGPHRGGGPGQRGRLVEDGAADPGAGEPVERDAPVRVPATGRGDQRVQAGAGEVVAVDVVGDPGEHVAHQVADERHVGADQLLLLGGGE